ncbi:type II toxin-antitoxin system VapC family toxin [Dongia sp.]|uniref:type II toxin-antitoxin system VapC family toxin n=1 Tax=Dongia sp. TaxID=1977262 RepID=UPI00375348AF
MSFLLDTNVVSEATRPQPHPGVLEWLATVDEDRIHLSVVTLAEVRHGIERMPAGSRRKRLDEWLRHDLVSRFEGRILPISPEIADAWGKIVARRDAVGRPIGAMDAFIAATAETHALTLVTRDVAGFETVVREIVNPWDAL